MLQNELWLRMSNVSRLPVKRAVDIINKLNKNNGKYSQKILQNYGLTTKQSSEFMRADVKQLESTLRWLENPEHHLVCIIDDLYPSNLAAISDPPLLFFVDGDLSVLTTQQIAIVGSRKCTLYGENWTQFFTTELVHNGFTITSGLALGIDGIAHNAALQAHGRTIAVLGSGFLQVYPSQHDELAEQIRQKNGALISEYLVSKPPLSINFPRRNRIISGLSLGVLVIEASMKSGSLITARYALDQGREVFALPGALGNPLSEGTHWLIQQGAYLVAHPKDIMETLKNDFHWLNSKNQDITPMMKHDITSPSVDMLTNVGDDVTSIDEIAERSGQSISVITSQLLELEVRGLIAAVSGGYVRIRGKKHVRH